MLRVHINLDFWEKEVERLENEGTTEEYQNALENLSIAKAEYENYLEGGENE